MVLLAALIFVFGILHLNPAIPGWKAHAVKTFGKAYGAVYGILNLVLLFAVFWAFHRVAPITIYDPPDWGRHANFAFSLLGFLFMGIFLFRGSWRNRLKYPMAIGICFWALGHLFANGDDRTTLLFAGLAAFGVLHALIKPRNGPFAPTVEREGHNLLSLMAGLALYGLAAQLHVVIAGVPLVTLQ